MNETAALITVTVSMFLCLAFFIWMVTSTIRRTRLARSQTELQTKLLDKFGSSQELLDYMKTEAGQRFIQTAPTEERRNPYSRILLSITAGTILTFLGIGFIVLHGPGGEFALLSFGTIFLAIGLGFLVSAGISYFLSKSWGLFDQEANRSQ